MLCGESTVTKSRLEFKTVNK